MAPMSMAKPRPKRAPMGNLFIAGLGRRGVWEVGDMLQMVKVIHK